MRAAAQGTEHWRTEGCPGEVATSPDRAPSDISGEIQTDPLEGAYYALRIETHMDTGDLPLKQRVADAMIAADKKTAHLKPDSEECARLWMQAFHDTLWRVTPDPGSTNLTRPA